MKHLQISLAGMVIAISLAITSCQTAPTPANERVRSNLFLSSIAALSGLEFPGWVDDAYTPENPFAGEPLVMRVLEADHQGARVALHVGEDRSRTWVLTTEPDGRVRLRHDHRDPDGTPHDLTDYGGVAQASTSHDVRMFPADEFTAQMLPEAATNVWTMRFDRENDVFIYNLTRHGRPRFRAVFDLSQPRMIE